MPRKSTVVVLILRARKTTFFWWFQIKALFLQHFTQQFTFFIHFTLINYLFIMAYVIGEDCVACGTCMAVCPTGAISEGDIYVIDPDTCISCGTCAESCPNEAISEG